MSATISSGKASFESVGSASRESSSAVNSQSYKNLTGKMLEIKTSVDGLEVKASDLTGKYTDLKATVDGLSSEAGKMQNHRRRQPGPGQRELQMLLAALAAALCMAMMAAQQ